ncbi:ASKHA domain-containing protein [Syntrophobacter fumaroxidans]|uniref:Ferredoxin n=1 Tax=Syntrophobacter fumaroxidans (strain DSM 10017 / MPOB) TaxID=335543 RepID=A0LGE3_SYNFM|nr:ASKHA domain-containing protein [Syntrophobacter fumaroxidans]ABK16495.1 ferredoxin [Syntrophobacter fumaroxidans MPOB]
MKSMKVTFQPEGTATHAEIGERLIDVASYAGIDVNNLCGGRGVCGKCRVRVLHGRVTATGKSIHFLDRNELESGFVLACQASTTGEDVEIYIPPESRIEEGQILTVDHIEEIVRYEVPAPLERGLDGLPATSFLRPVCQKYYLELARPSLSDNLSDLDRIYRELRKKMPDIYIEAHFACLSGLAALLRESDWKVTATVHLRNARFGQIRMIEKGNTADVNYGIAVDVGTTTIVAQLVDLNTGVPAAVEASYNRQASYGEDVLSRMIFACDFGGLQPLNEAVVSTINSLVDALAAMVGIEANDIHCLMAAGNPTMTHLLLGLYPGHIRVEPYIPTANRFPQYQTAEIGLRVNPAGLLHIMPGVSGYVGGDITAGVLACGMNERSDIILLIDVGTNGEIVVGNKEWLACCSSSAGPAFEGGGIKCGMRATRGAIDKISLQGGAVQYHWIGNGKPRGVCGSGLIDAVAELLLEGIIDQRGKFVDLDHERIRVTDEIPEFILAPEGETENGSPVVITEADIGNLIKSKGAILAAVRVLLENVSLSFDDLAYIYVAGGFGAYLDVRKAILIGLLPEIPRERVRFIGNSSLAGARLAMLTAANFHKAESISSRMTYFELSVHPAFMNEFVAALFLPHTQIELFPSVREALAERRTRNAAHRSR